MNEENCYEQLAEVFLSLSDQHSGEDIYCLCSRVVIKGYNFEEIDCLKDTSAGPETNVHFFSSSTESPPQQKLINKKESHEEVVSCYCSASHCSTDEHDSIREGALHSDSGADLSESSRDLEWEKYWATNGERIVWDSWFAKYSDYIDPSFTKEFETEETLFIVDSNTTNTSVHKTTFSGCLDSIKETNESSSAESGEVVAPQDATDENPLRLSFSSESSKLSFSVGTTTDSLTNVTRVTVSSSDFSFDDSSKSGLSSDSSSNEHQWQQIWAEHVDQQYQLSYHEFVSKRRFATPPYVGEELFNFNTPHFNSELEENKENLCLDLELSASEVPLVLEDSHHSFEKNLNTDLSSGSHPPIILGSGTPYMHLDNKDNTTNKKLTESPSRLEKTSPKISHRRVKALGSRLHSLRKTGLLKKQESVGYLLQSLKDISLEEEERLLEDQVSSSESDNMASPAPHASSPRHVSKNSLKRVHDDDCESLDRVKGAFTLMGFMFKPGEPSESIRENFRAAQVVYKKRNIRSHNRALRFNPPQDNQSPKQVLLEKVRKFLDESEVGSFNLEGMEPPPVDHELFSEKDDSESDRYYSAEDATPSRERQQKRKKKRKKPALPKEIVDDMGLVKYWRQRYRLFSKFDQGIRLDSESWYSVTPEKVASHIAERCRSDVIIDAFCGAGGNTIQFAFTCEKVIAIDIDAEKIELARHNAQVYGVEDRIDFIVGDFISLCPSLKADVVFLSPPWGGPSYSKKKTFTLDGILPSFGGKQLYDVTKQITPNIAVYLPKNINSNELIQLAGPGGFVEMEQNFLEKKLIAVTAYFGELVGTQQ